ncbi:hypothetical protein [Bartonella sp. CB175]|uniref:hypothetical protein n=1 Tax=Bartonella sp. CB175 TaxID=3112256 RepID=UPI00300E680F
MADHRQQVHILEDHNNTETCTPLDHPLDPAVERVRKKLMRLMIISISITLVLLLAVLLGIVYKVVATHSIPQEGISFSFDAKNPKISQHTLSLPKNTQILSQSLSEHNIVLKILTPDGQTKFVIYNYDTGALVAILSVDITQEASTIISN